MTFKVQNDNYFSDIVLSVKLFLNCHPSNIRLIHNVEYIKCADGQAGPELIVL